MHQAPNAPSLLVHAMSWFCILAILPGCGSHEVATYPVQGQVIYKNKPVASAVVMLHPAGTTDGTMANTPKAVLQIPTGYCNEQGEFRISTRGAEDGAPAGDYVVTVELRAERLIGEEMVRDGQNLLPPRFAQAKSSPLRCTISIAENSLPPFELKD